MWLDCGACACAHFSCVCSDARTSMCGRPDDTHAGACSCTIWVERKTTVRQTASRQHIEKSAWASAAQHSTKPLWPVWDGYHRQRGCGAWSNLSQCYCHVAIHRIVTSSIEQIMIESGLCLTCPSAIAT